MSYEYFKERISGIASSLGVRVVFRHDKIRGRYTARCENGDIITGNPSSRKVTGNLNGHVMMATL